MPHVVKAPEAGHGDVYVLGAGFSKAAYRRMPLTDDLGRLVLARLTDADLMLGRPTFEAGGLTFESWLSWLGEAQPFDDPEAAHLRRALFVRLQRLIAETLDEAAGLAMEEPPAFWLFKLVQLFQLGHATVITFNYDRVVEANIPERLTDTAGEFVQPNDIVVPLFTESGFLFQDSRPHPRDIDAFDYLKLHGSVDWWVFPDDTSGASLEQGPSTAELTRAQRGLRSTRQRFIVPPTAQKSGYYASELTRFLWRQAASALTSAKRVAVLGYSLPLTDNATGSMLASTVALGAASIDVVNPDAEGVRQRLAAVGCASDRMTSWSDPRCIEAYVDDRCEELAAAFAKRFAGLVRGSDCLAFAWNAEQRAQVEHARLEHNGRDLVLTTSHVGGEGLVRPEAVLLAGQQATRAMLGSQLPAGYESATRIVLEYKELGWLAVGTVQHAVVNGPDDDHWLTLYPIGTPPSRWH